MNPKNGEWTLQNAEGRELIPLHTIGDLAQETFAANSQIALALGWDTNKSVYVYGCGNGVNALQQTKTKTGLNNGVAVIPYFWSPAGYAVLAISANDNRPAYWRAAANGKSVTWIFPGASAGLYLMPAATLKVAASAYADLTGHAPVPPLWAFGYLQSRWGWKNRAYIEARCNIFRI